MSDQSDLKKELLKQNGIAVGEPGGNADLERIHRMIQKERAKIRQMKFVTLGLWIVALCGLKWGPNPQDLFGDLPRHLAWFYFVLILKNLLPVAVLSTIVLWIRTWNPSRRELSLRLAAIEEQLRLLEKDPNKR
jgi:hypothetical protein